MAWRAASKRAIIIGSVDICSGPSKIGKKPSPVLGTIMMPWLMKAPPFVKGGGILDLTVSFSVKILMIFFGKIDCDFEMSTEPETHAINSLQCAHGGYLINQLQIGQEC